MNRVLLLVFVCCVFPRVVAQRRGVVVNMETGVPMRDVLVMTNMGEQVKTNYLGQYQLMRPFRSLTLTHSGFVSLSMERSQLTDTVALLPKFNTLDEVEVWGKSRQIDKNAVKPAPGYPMFNAPAAGISFDFFQLFVRQKLSGKQRKKHKWIIENY